MAALIIGVAVGAVGGFLVRGNADMFLINGLVGLAGSILGYVLFLLGFSDRFAFFSWTGVLASLIGALVLVLGFSWLQYSLPQRTLQSLDSDIEEADDD